jgi:hypothetical protein
MTPPLPPSPRGPGCPPAATLEALSAGEPADAATRAHVDACPRCAPQLAALREAHEAFLRARPADRFLGQLARREAAAAAPRTGVPWRRLFPGLAVALPLLLLVLLYPDALSRRQDDAAVGFKGALTVVASRDGGGEVRTLGPDSPVRAGDALRFGYASPEAGHLLVLELDGRGEASVFHPFGGARSAPLAANQQALLPGAVELDDAPGPRWLVAVFSRAPLEAAPLLAQLRGQAGRARPELACEGCTVTPLRLQVARP